MANDPVNRSGSGYSSPRDGNRVPALFGVSTVDGVTPVPLEVNPSNGQLQTSGSGGTASSVALNDGVTTTRKATVAGLTNSNPLAVEIVDGNGNQITSFGGGTQYQELATTSPATGTLSLGRYQTSLPTLTNGQINEPMLDSTSTLLVNSSTLAKESGGNLATIVTNTTNAATTTLQTTGNTTLSTIATNPAVTISWI